MNPEDARSTEELIMALQRDVRPKYVLFWGHTPRVPGVLDQSCLSNWFPASFTLDGAFYPTAEHYMMAEKARLFADQAVRDRILAAESPGKAKDLGRRVVGFDESIWKMNRFNIVVAGSLEKFRQNPDLRGLLSKTGSKVLVEASPRDRIWGIGLGKNHENADDPTKWLGLNLLGFALMEVRLRLSNVEQST